MVKKQTIKSINKYKVIIALLILLGFLITLPHTELVENEIKEKKPAEIELYLYLQESVESTEELRLNVENK